MTTPSFEPQLYHFSSIFGNCTCSLRMAPGRLLSNCATAAFTRCLRQGRSASAITPSSGRHGTMGHRRRDRTHLWITSAASTMIQKEDVITGEPDNNVTDNIYSKIGVNLHLQQNHPLCILKNAIYDYFKSVALCFQSDFKIWFVA